MAWLFFAAILIIAYLIGSVNTAIIISKVIGHKDVRDSGSGNAGMTNVMRTMGFLPGLVTFLIDASKAAAVCALGRLVVFPYLYSQLGFEFLRPEYGVYYCGIMCIIGTVFPIFFGFKGGKGVASSCGIILVCEWKSAVIALTLFVIILLKVTNNPMQSTAFGTGIGWLFMIAFELPILMVNIRKLKESEN